MASSIGFGPTYDWPASRWLPVPRALVSPDGTSYVYAQLVFPPVGPTPQNGPGPGPIGSRVHVVDVATAGDRVVLDTPTLWSAVAYSGRQVYLIHACIECGSGDGALWSLDVSTDVLEQIAAPEPVTQAQSGFGHSWAVVGPDAAWSTDSQGGLARLDLASKTISVWFSVPGKMLDPIGLDARGLPIVEGEANYSIAGSTRGGAWLVMTPQHAIRIAPDSELINEALADDFGIWLLSLGNVELWTLDGHWTQVGTIPVQGDLSLGGPCQ